MLAVCLVDARALGIDAAVMAPASGERWCVLRSTPLLRSGRAVAREPLPGRLFGRSFVSGTPFRLDPTAELAAYRIIQEALTNARRHAPGAAVDVELRYTDHALQLRIRDNGPGPPPMTPARGHGMPGMRERAAAVGGRLRTGPAPGGGLLVEATVPQNPEAPE